MWGRLVAAPPTSRPRSGRLHVAARVWIFVCLPCCCCLSQRLPKKTLAESLLRIQSIVKGVGGPVARRDSVAATSSRDAIASLNLTASTEPARFRARPEQIPNLLSASVPALLRFGSGAFAQEYRLSIEQPCNLQRYSLFRFQNAQLIESGLSRFSPDSDPLILYDVESCPNCRRVREACSMLSLSVTFLPALTKGRRYLKQARQAFGDSAATPPLLIDPNTSVKLIDPDAIIQYLFKAYGDGKVPWTLQSGFVSTATSGIAVGLCRLGAGGRYRSSNPPNDEQAPLVLWSYEGSPFCKVVRETLSSLEVPHTVVFAPRGSPNRQRLFDRAGFFQVPYLEDPGASMGLHESEAINEYLVKKFAVPASPVPYV